MYGQTETSWLRLPRELWEDFIKLYIPLERRGWFIAKILKWRHGKDERVFMERSICRWKWKLQPQSVVYFDHPRIPMFQRSKARLWNHPDYAGSLVSTNYIHLKQITRMKSSLSVKPFNFRKKKKKKFRSFFHDEKIIY